MLQKKQYQGKSTWIRVVPFAPIPAALIGVYTMRYFDVPNQIWLFNLVAVSSGTFLSLLYSGNIIMFRKINLKLITWIGVIILLTTFRNEGIMDVHRWINIKSFQIHVGFIVAPIFLIQVSKISNPLYSLFFIALIAIVFVLQPDASQLTAFTIAALLMLSGELKNKIVIILTLFIVVGLVTFSWYNLDTLEAVSYVENIVQMTYEISVFLSILSILSLLILVLPFFMNDSRKKKLSMSLGVYYSILIASSWIGNFPVIVMGYGIAPIMGYFIGLIWLINNQTEIYPETKNT